MIASRHARLITARLTGARGCFATAAVAAAVAVGGCAAVPTSGAVQQFGNAQAGSALPKDYPQEIPEPPRPGWDPRQIVQGFLVASASFADDHAVAREYLDPTAHWHPSWAVTVVSSPTAAIVSDLSRQLSRSQADQADQYAEVVVKGIQVATLTSTGQAQTPAKPKASFSFKLDRVDGEWRIKNPPANLLLLQEDFPYVYKPQNVYFLAPSGRTLVPDPVFVPQQDTNAELATGLVDALLQDPTGWLEGAAATGFPRKSSLLGLRINGPNATVNLGGKAATAKWRQQEQMAAQLAWTLGSGPAAIQSVEMQINGRPLLIGHRQLQLLQSYASWMPAPSAGSSLYFIGSGGAVKALSGVGPPGSGQLGSVKPVTGAAGTPPVPPLGSIAVSPDGRWIAGISAGDRKTVYAWDLTHKDALREWRSSPGPCTSLSWDAQGDLWIAAGGSVWLLPPGKDSAVPVSLSLPGPAVTSFQVAPDGVRAVMIANNDQLQLVAIVRNGGQSLGQTVVPIGSGIGEPESLSWYDANNVIVLDGNSSGGQLWEVPLNGGAPSAIPSVGNIGSVTAASPNIAIGLAYGQVMVSANLGAFENTRATGQAPVYPG